MCKFVLAQLVSLLQSVILHTVFCAQLLRCFRLVERRAKFSVLGQTVGLTTPQYIGLGVGFGVLVILLVVGVWYCFCRTKDSPVNTLQRVESNSSSKDRDSGHIRTTRSSGE